MAAKVKTQKFPPYFPDGTKRNERDQKIRHNSDRKRYGYVTFDF